MRDVVCRREGGVLWVEKQRYSDNLSLIVAPLGVLLGCIAIRKHVYRRESERESERNRERHSEGRAREPENESESQHDTTYSARSVPVCI